MPEIRPAFDDADAYERYMGAWSRGAGERFINWIAPARNARWLDVGCGTGAFGALVTERCAPAALSGIDPSAQQVAAARARLPGAGLRVGDAMALPFADGAFEIVASALVLHFIPDRAKAFAEMKRVAVPGALIAGYTWERTPDADSAPYAPMLRGILSMGLEPLRSPTVPEQTLEGLRTSAEAADLSDVAVTHIETTRSFSNFEAWWEVQTLTVSPIGKMIAGFDAAPRERLRAIMRASLPVAADGSIAYAARAVAFKARA